MRWRHAHFDVVSRYLVSPHSPLTAKISKDEGINISPNVHGNGSHDDYMHAQSEKKTVSTCDFCCQNGSFDQDRILNGLLITTLGKKVHMLKMSFSQ